MQYVDYNVIQTNGKFFKSKLSSGVKLCAVIKNNAYGHGIEQTAQCLYQIVDIFAVGSVREALSIEKFGKDVLILLPQNNRDCKIAVEHEFVLTLDSFSTLKTLLKASKGNGVRAHIKIDSGMSRLGFKKRDLLSLIEELSQTNIAVEGIFSHLYSQNKNNCDEQLNYFEKCCKIVLSKLGKNLIRHVANTSATLLDAKYHLDMVRVGLGLYGYGASNLSVAKTVYAKVIAVKNLYKGDIVGYDAAFVCKQNTKIAVVNVGYADGYCRTLCGSSVKIGSGYYQVVGNVCMGMLFVDVTNGKVKIGDDVILLGEGVNPANGDTIIYELLCNMR